MNETGTSLEHKRLVAAAALGGLLLYGLSCAPGVLWQDSAAFQYRVWFTDLRGNLGLALAHPLYVLLAKAFTVLPLGDDFAFRVNLFSAICGAGSLALAMDLLLSVTASRAAATVGTAMLAVSHTFYTHAVIAEVYNLYGLALLSELWLIERSFSLRQNRWLILALVVCGLNVSNHLLAILHLPAYAVVVIVACRSKLMSARQVPLLIPAFVIGTLPYSALILCDIAQGEPVSATFKSALFGNKYADKVLNLSVSLSEQGPQTLSYFVLNFPTPLLLTLPWGVWAAWKARRTRWLVSVGGMIFVLTFIFAFRYPVPDQYVFFFPCYVLIPLFVSVAVARWIKESAARQAICLVLAILPAFVYEFAPALARHWNIPIGITRDIPFRDTYAYFLRPRKNGDDGAGRFARSALRQAEPDGLLVADSTIVNALAYVRDVEGTGRGVALALTSSMTPAEPTVPLSLEAIRSFAERHPVYLCTDAPGYVPGWLTEEFEPVPAGILYRLEPKPQPAVQQESP